MTSSKEKINIEEPIVNKPTDKTFIIFAKIKKCYPFPAKFRHEKQCVIELDYFDEGVINTEFFKQSEDWIKSGFGFTWVANRPGKLGKTVRGHTILLNTFYENAAGNMRRFAKYIVGTYCLLLSRVMPICQKKKKREEGHECGEKSDCVYKNEVCKEKLFFSAYPLLRRFIKYGSKK